MSLENFLIVVVRTMLGLFLSSLLALALYIVALSTILTTGELQELNYRLITTATVSVGAGLGGFLAWLRPDRGLHRNILTLGLALAPSAVGALVGTQYGKTLLGAVLVGNLALMALTVLETLRDRDVT